MEAVVYSILETESAITGLGGMTLQKELQWLFVKNQNFLIHYIYSWMANLV